MSSPGDQPPRARPRLLQLDVLRGIAVLLVLGRHPFSSRDDAGPFRPLSDWWFRFGWTGVDLFFVLSGFLIGGLLFGEILRDGKLDVRRFLIRRGFKIWPSYYAFLAFVAVVLLMRLRPWLAIGYPIEGRPFEVFKALIWNVLHIQNYRHTIRIHTWSLSVEEHFYLLLPLVLAFLIRRDRPGEPGGSGLRAIPPIAFALIVLCTAGRYLTSLRHPTDFFRVIIPTHLRVDGLFVGVLLAYWDHFRPGWRPAVARHRGALLAVGLLLISPMMVFDSEVEPLVFSIGPTLLYLGYAAILSAVVTTPIGEGWMGRLLGSPASRVVAFIGFYSYPIYLWQFDLAWAPLHWLSTTRAWAATSPPARWSLGMAAFVVLSTAGGVAMSRLIERPALALRDRFFPARAPAVESIPPPEEPSIPDERPVPARLP